MIVEDEVFVRMGLKTMIRWEALGLSLCAEAANGEDAYRLCLEHKPDIILTDLRMPVMNGIELIRKIRARNRRVRFIILTCLDEFAPAQEAIELGVSSYVLKHTSGVAEIEAKLLAAREELLCRERGELGCADLRTGEAPGLPAEVGPEAARSLGPCGINPYPHPKVRAALEYLRANYEQEQSLRDVADALEITPGYLSRLFRMHGQRGFIETLNDIRIAHAQSLLRDTSLPIHTVGRRVGFSNTTYFIRVFRKCTGSTPNEYRALTREGL